MACNRRCFSSVARSVSVKSDLRQKFSGITTTVFGGGGYLGKDVVNGFARIGSQVVVPFRDDGLWVRPLKIAGDLGQVLTVPVCDLSSVDSIVEFIGRSKVVVNLMDQSVIPYRLDPNDDKYELFRRTSVDYARNIAEACRVSGVQRFFHFSDLAACPDHPYTPFRYKYEGERAVLEAFPEATILRPGPVFGPGDRFITTLATWFEMAPFFPMLNPTQELQPVFLEDISRAILACLKISESAGRTYNLVGEEVYLLEDLFKLICVRMLEDPFHNKIFRLPNSMMTVHALKLMFKLHRAPKYFMYKPLPHHVLEHQLMDISHHSRGVDSLGRPCGTLADLNVKGEPLTEHLQSLIMDVRKPHITHGLVEIDSPDNVYQYFRPMENVAFGPKPHRD